MKLWVKTLIAMTLGFACGLLLGPNAEYLRPIGTLFVSMIQMTIVLLVLSSMVAGVTSIHDFKKLGRVGIKSVSIYFISTVIAICFGFLIAEIMQPGAAMGLATTGVTDAASQGSLQLKDIFMTLVPKNPVAALVEGNVLQIIVFSAFLGIAIHLSGEKGRPVGQFFESLANVMYRLVAIVMKFSPIGIFAIMAWVSGSFGLAVLIPLLKFLTSFYMACLLQIFVVFCGLLWVVGRLKALPFFKGMMDSIMMAFSTASSSASLPITMHCVQENLGVSKNIAGFLIPFGLAMNMNGTAIFQAMASMFIAQAYGIHLGWQEMLTIIVATIMSSIGTAGVAGAGIIMLTVVLNSVGLPLEGIAILAGVDRLRDMFGTVTNVLGDAVCAVCISKQEGELDEKVYYTAEVVKFQEHSVNVSS